MAHLIQMPRNGNLSSWSEALADPRCRDDLVEAVTSFRAVLGDHWRGWTLGSPLATGFFTSVVSPIPEGVRIYHLIVELGGASSLSNLIRRQLGSNRWPDFLSGVMTLEICSRIRARGCHVVLLPERQTPTPDATVRLDGRDLILEFKALHDSTEVIEWEDFVEGQLQSLWAEGLNPWVFDIHLKQAALREPVLLARELRRALAGGAFDVPLANGIGHLRRATGTGSVSMPIAQTPEAERIASKLGSWCRSLRGCEGHPTVLIVQTRLLFGQMDQPTIARNLLHVRKLAMPLLRSMPSVSAILLYSENFMATCQPHHARGVAGNFVIDRSPDGHPRAGVLFLNPAARTPLTDRERESFVGPDMTW